MAGRIDAKEVARHNTSESCWVILYGTVYNVTDFLPNHPGGPNAILRWAGRDATGDYHPIHPPGTLEEHLDPTARIGPVDPGTIEKSDARTSASLAEADSPPLDTLLNLDDIEALATKRISQKAWAYYYSAADDLISKRLNSEAYRSILFRPRIFVDCANCDVSTTLLGNKVQVPFYVSPAAMARLAHPAGEAGIARACGKYGALQLISNNASMTPEQIVQDALPGQVFGWQLYAQTNRKQSEDMLRRIQRMPDRFKFIALTLDAPAPGKREHDERARNIASHLPITSALQQSGDTIVPAAGAGAGGTGTVTGLSTAATLFGGTDPTLTWTETLPWLARHTTLPLLLKGVQTHEDAYLASQHFPQVRGIILSNHGGRQLDTAPPALHTLLEIRKYCPDVFDKLEVWLDGGVRRGADVVKALCLGARGVGLGRAPLWGLGAAGPEGVERTFEILKAEMETAMRLLGLQSIDQLGPQYVNARELQGRIYDGPAELEGLRLGQKAKAKARL